MSTGMTERTGIGRVQVQVRGVVQGVGFRPFVYRLARDLGLSGWVRNTQDGVLIEAEGPQDGLLLLLRRLRREGPPGAVVHRIEHHPLAPTGAPGSFAVRCSDSSGERTVLLTPDLATCAACLREVLDPADRRYRYPFANCTSCGPRYSILLALPYDRPGTTMRRFTMCVRCQTEYDDPADRRFHAQPNACPQCGPRLELRDGISRVLEHGDRALRKAAQAIGAGAIVAVKGLGGFHLLADARCQDAVQRLRGRKRRDEKPFAVMVPGLSWVRERCELSPQEARLLRCAAAPIVLVRRRAAACVADAVAPDGPLLGALLPYTPLHHLLLRELGHAVVATSGNLAGEPLCIDEDQAGRRLGGIADLLLCHDRPIARPVDDSVARVVQGRPLLLRRARGYAPLPLRLPRHVDGRRAVAAVGGHLKNTVALTVGGALLLSQHIGDLETLEAVVACERALSGLTGLYGSRPEVVACDLHPDYRSTKLAEDLAGRLGVPLLRVQHHHAHALACLADCRLAPPALGVVWDGAGLGPDGTLWGGEFLHLTAGGFARVAHLRCFPLPGGEQAAREPRRAALGALYEVLGEDGLAGSGLAPLQAFSQQERGLLLGMLRRGVQTPRTSSVGRLFDAMAALLGLRQRASFEGQAALLLEAAVDAGPPGAGYPFALRRGSTGVTEIDWGPMLLAVLEELDRQAPPGRIAARFHDTLVEILVAVANGAGLALVALSGGCFQNRVLTERAVRRLRQEGLRPCWHRDLPPNDGGLAAGQALAALESLPPAPRAARAV